MLRHCVGRVSLRSFLPTTNTRIVRYTHAYQAKTFTPRPDGPNYRIVQHLIHEFETEAQKDNFTLYKARAFQRAIKTLDELPEAIESGGQAQKIPSIGNGISRRIEEFLNASGQSSSSLSPSVSVNPDEVARERLLSELTKVPGVGPVKARKLLDSGCRSLEDLRKPEYNSLLSSSSKAVLDFVGHLDQRTPRSHVDSVIDVIKNTNTYCRTLVEGSRKWQGIARIPEEGEDNLERVRGVRDRLGTFRRMDITLYPILSEGAALLASTGDADFNSYLRKIASSMGLRLNEFGLWRHYQAPSTPSYDGPESHIQTDKKRKGTEDDGRWELIASQTEQEIFDELNVEYVEPERRNFSYIATKMKSKRTK